MTNTLELKKAILDSGCSAGDCAKRLNISRASFSNKLNNKTDFWATEIQKLSDMLNLTPEQRTLIFFNGN